MQPEKIQVLVRDRREGKTTELIKWLLEGHMQDGYPQWSRVIVTPTSKMVVHTSKMVASHLSGEYLCQHSNPHLAEGCKFAHKHTAAQISKAVWGFKDFNFNAQGAREFEYALDDADFLYTGNSTTLYSPNGRRPSIVVLTGELYSG